MPPALPAAGVLPSSFDGVAVIGRLPDQMDQQTNPELSRRFRKHSTASPAGAGTFGVYMLLTCQGAAMTKLGLISAIMVLATAPVAAHAESACLGGWASVGQVVHGPILD